LACQQRADVGQPHQPVTAGVGIGQHVGDFALHLAGLPRVAVAYASQKLDAVRQRGRALQRFDHAQQPRSTYCESAGQLDAIAVDVVERQRRSHPRMRVIGRRDPGCTGADSARMTTSLALLGEGSFAW
jgi:hypothetical protein